MSVSQSATPGEDRATVPRGRFRWRAWWPMAATLALIVASEYKFRLRADDQSVAGQADPFVLLEIGIYALVGLGLFLHFRPAARLRRAEPVTVLLYAYVLVLAGSALYSMYLQLAVVRAAQVVVALALVRAIARHTGPAAPHRIAHGYAVLLAASVIFGVLVPFPRLASQPDRFTWLYLHPVQAGELLAIAVILLAGYVLTHGLERAGPRWPLPLYVGLLLVCAGGLVATKTRGAVVGAVVGVLLLLWNRWRGVRKVELSVVGLTALVVLALSGSAAIESFFARGESAEQLATLNSRATLWGYAIDLAAQHPLYGFGLTATRGVFLQSIGLGGGHNAVINLLVDTGLLGVTAWIALLVAIFLRTARIPRSGDGQVVRILVFALLTGMLANSFFTQGLGAPATGSSTWLFVIATWVVLAGDRARRSARTEVDR